MLRPKQLLEKSLIKLDKNNNKHHFKIAKMLAYLGNIYIEAGDFENIFQYEYFENEGIECRATGDFKNICALKGNKIKSSGNSFACPVISGIIALLLENFPNSNINDIRTLLKKTFVKKNRRLFF